MKKEDIQELKIMEEFGRSDGIASQREIARKLEISLGLVNAFVKRIVRKGYFKVSTILGRRVRYLLTPKGIVENSRLLCSSTIFGEGFSNVIGEAMACGVLCVATDVGDSARIVGDTGIIVLPGDPEALTGGCETLIRSIRNGEPDLRVRARDRIAGHFSRWPLIEATMNPLGATQ